MPDDVRMDFDAMEDMVRAFHQGAGRLEDVASAVRQIVDLLEGGALVSQQGTRWADSLRNRLLPLLLNGSQSYQQIAQELDGALRDLRDGDVEAASRFSG